MLSNFIIVLVKPSPISLFFISYARNADLYDL